MLSRLGTHLRPDSHPLQIPLEAYVHHEAKSRTFRDIHSREMNESKRPTRGKPVPKPSDKFRGNPREPEEVRISKTLSYILRHGAKNEGLRMREDGYVQVRDLVRLRTTRF